MARNSWSPCRILIIGGSGSGKADVLLNIINHEPDIDKIYLYAKNPSEPKYQLLINKRMCGLKIFKWSKSLYWILKWYEWYL